MKKNAKIKKSGKSALDYKIREVEIRCPKESDYHSAACAKALGDADHADLIALNRGDAERPTVVYSYRGEKKIVWGVKERAISVNGKVVGVDLSDLDEQQAIALVRKHCKGIETVVWANADSLYVGGTKVGLRGFKILSKLGDLQRLPVKNGEWTTSKVCSSRGIEWLVVDNGDLYYHEGGCKIMSVRRINRRSRSIELCCVDDDAWAADPKYECHKQSAVITIHNDNSFSLKFSISSDLDGKHIHCPKNAGY